LRRRKPRLVVFSGFGGEILKKDLLDSGAPLLHLHAGRLPDYRGSTTVYYSYIRERRLGVSALFLRERIDQGPVIARKWYPPPPPGMELDYLYDSAIRADLLVQVMTEWARYGKFRRLIRQSPNEGTVYYVIHPLLKHVALDHLREEQTSQ
jgi:methionyl-tRNA formyltransferase